MSGILIKHFIVPSNCMECEWRDAEACGQCELMIDNPFLSFSYQYAHCPFQMIAKRHPLVPVPEPHGRLGDLDALIADLKRQCKEVFRIDAVSPDDFWIERNEAYNERLWETWCESFYKYLESRPTVIPASEEAE